MVLDKEFLANLFVFSMFLVLIGYIHHAVIIYLTMRRMERAYASIMIPIGAVFLAIAMLYVTIIVIPEIPIDVGTRRLVAIAWQWLQIGALIILVMGWHSIYASLRGHKSVVNNIKWLLSRIAIRIRNIHSSPKR